MCVSDVWEFIRCFHDPLITVSFMIYLIYDNHRIKNLLRSNTCKCSPDCCILPEVSKPVTKKAPPRRKR